MEARYLEMGLEEAVTLTAGLSHYGQLVEGPASVTLRK